MRRNVPPRTFLGKVPLLGGKFVTAQYTLSVRMLSSRIRFVAARISARYSSRRRVFSSSFVSATDKMDGDDLRSRERQKEKKQTLRARVRAKLKATFSSSREEDETTTKRLLDSKVICEKVLELDAFKNARRMCVYIAHPKLHEVDCSVLIREALDSSSSEFGEEKVKVYVPIVDDKNSNVRFLRVRDMEKDLEKRTMGIMEPTELDWRTNEPREDVADLKENEKLDLVIAPGLAFDETCKRLGRGGGYYDKFLSEGKGREAVKIGLAFDAQIVDADEIPLDPWDVVLDLVVSKSHVYRKKEQNT